MFFTKPISLLLLLSVFSLRGMEDHGLVDLAQKDSSFVFDIRYATNNNFCGKVLYNQARAFLHKDAAESLVKAHNKLKEKGLRLKIFDGFRPFSVQEIMWAIVPDERYVIEAKRDASGKPIKGGRHNRALAIDVTLVDDETKQEIPMGTEYDDFSERAHITCKDFSEEILRNRLLLQNTMAEFGFKVLETEWWHYDYKGWDEKDSQGQFIHPLIDVSFEELAKN